MNEDQVTNVRNSIAVYKTDKRLVEFRDKLNPSFWGNYAELHGHADVDGNGKVYSNIGVVLYDYSNGTGNNTVKVYVNVTPEDIYWLYNALTSHTENFELEQTKIFGQPDNNGYSQMTTGTARSSPPTMRARLRTPPGRCTSTTWVMSATTRP